MSHLRAPAARADRRESGRHGRPARSAAPPLPEARIRPQLLRIAVLPAVAVGLCGSAAVLFLIRDTEARPRLPLLAVLGAAALLGLASVVIAAVAAERAARSVRDRVGALRRASVRGQADLRELVEQLRRGEAPPAPGQPPARPVAEGDEFGSLAEELSRAHDGAVTAVVQAAQLSSQAGSEQKVEVFVNLARRLQSLVHREISLLDDLENTVEDPELLKGLFHIDHLATRIRRHAENLAVLGGAMSRRQWSRPVTMTEVLRSSIAEVEQYSRVKLVPPIDGTLRGHAVADVIHLLAELVENATVFSAPHTQVLLRANLVTAGLAVEVEDRGLGMPLAEQARMNQLLADPDQVNVASLLQDGRIGLFVVAALARRHGIAVRLQTNIYGGVQAVLILPQGLLGAEQEDVPSAARGGAGGVSGAGGASGVGGTGGAGASGGVSGLVPGPRQAASGYAGPASTPTPPPATANPSASAPDPAGNPASTTSRPRHSAQPRHSARRHTPQTSAQPQPPAQQHSPSYQETHTPQESLAPHQPLQSDHPYQSHDPLGLQETGTPQEPGAAAPHTSHTPHTPPAPRYGHAGANGTPGATNPTGPGATTQPGPLPVRGPRGDRPTPAEAVPGIRPEDRQSAIEHTATPPLPRNGAVRGRVGRPQLPKRRAQEHLAPQLRDARAPRADDEHVGHDPGLMAAFQRGIGLAQAAEVRDVPRDGAAGTNPGPGPTATADRAGRVDQGG
ncbi:sensor histidine kinase [Streptomyces flavofungini]|uniref:sensor histidine kinase n=1 Tax=Streptomyces flavofungini TaxID=68200 RepID=UPI0025AF787F|nr:ATP-binding protein [Streptomyces flavofungini]WJV45066.1 ATP-binding protein [Streptomyces flavofungini]